jgi:hypothetical protein
LESEKMTLPLSSWPADKVERWPVAKLVPNARNARTHGDEQVTQLAASIEEWGWTIPVLVDDAGGIIAGHGRVMAAHRLGIEDVPVMVAAWWNDAEKGTGLIRPLEFETMPLAGFASTINRGQQESAPPHLGGGSI